MRQSTYLLIILLLCACKTITIEAQEILYVNSEVVDCYGVIKQECMQVRTDESTEWRLFYDRIDGFQHKEGNNYKLLVNIIRVENPPQDGSSMRYELKKIIEQHRSII